MREKVFMNKLFTLCLLGLLAAPVWAELAKADNAELTKRASLFSAEDFANQSVLTISSGDGGNAKRCQAVRITPRWYLTAAHCVYDRCGGKKDSCMVDVDLLQCGTLKASASVQHVRSNSKVFIPSQYKPGSKVDDLVRSDVALLRFAPSEKDYWFYDAVNGHDLTYGEFLQALNRAENSDCRNQWETLRSSRPELLVVNNSENRRITQPLAVPNFAEEEGESRAEGLPFLSNKTDDFYYRKEDLAMTHPLRGLYAGSNFGLKPGKSGSGVVVPGGAVIGVVSIDLDDGKDVALAPINSKNRDFIKNTVSRHSSRGEKMPRFGRLSVHHSEIVK